MKIEIMFHKKFTDRGDVKKKLRSNEQSSILEYELVMNSYKILEYLKNADLAIKSSLELNSNIQLYAHQVLAAKKMKNQFGGTGILADEVGLGKTVEAGIIIKEFLMTGIVQSVLILTPPSLIYQWQNEMESKFNLKFFQRDDPNYIDISSHDLLICSHPGAVFHSQKQKLISRNWDMVIVDEAHSLKNSETLKYKLVREITKKYTILLSATPIQNNLLELFTLVDLLRPGILGTKTHFKNKFADDSTLRKINPLFKDEFQNILSNIIIRTTRKEVKKEIKFTDRIPITKILKGGSDELTLYEKITNKLRKVYDEGGNTLFLISIQKFISSSNWTTQKALKHMLVNKIITGKEYDEFKILSNKIKIDTKAKELLDIINNRKSEKFLIFTEYTLTQDYLAEILQKNGFSITIFNGSMNLEDRKLAIDQFKEKVQIMISTSAGGQGQNFQFCNNVVNYDLPWNPMAIEQRVGRVHRIGQKKNVNIFNLAYEKTIDAYILELLYEKIQLFTMTLGHLDLLFEDITNEDSESSIFTEYMTAKDEKDAKRKFSALGEKWAERKNKVNLIEGLNSEIFDNFSLSTMETNYE